MSMLAVDPNNNNALWDSKNHPDLLTARGLDMLLIDSFAIEVLRA